MCTVKAIAMFMFLCGMMKTFAIQWTHLFDCQLEKCLATLGAARIIGKTSHCKLRRRLVGDVVTVTNSVYVLERSPRECHALSGRCSRYQYIMRILHQRIIAERISSRFVVHVILDYMLELEDGQIPRQGS
jgi:hypothetical protein